VSKLTQEGASDKQGTVCFLFVASLRIILHKYGSRVLTCRNVDTQTHMDKLIGAILQLSIAYSPYVKRHCDCHTSLLFSRGSWEVIWSRDSSVGIATGYGLDDRGVGVRVPVGSRIFSSPRRPDRLWGPHSLLSDGYRGLFHRGLSGWGVKLTNHLQLLPRSRKCRHCVVLNQFNTGTTLHYL
jgi:hypothetical protein